MAKKKQLEKIPDTTRVDEAQTALYTLVRDLFPGKQGDEITASFDAVLTAYTKTSERLEVIEYWTDFYRLQEYRRLKKRRRPTVKERKTPCSACGYPSSHRHHLWDVATHGENQVTLQLCANCHELHHLIYNALVKSSDYSQSIIQHVMNSGQVPVTVIEKVLSWCLATIRYEAQHGWVDGAKGAQSWVEERLGWSKFQEQK